MMGRYAAVALALLLPFLLSIGSDAGSIEARNSRAPAVPGRYIVVLQPGVDASSVAVTHGARPDFAYEHALNGFAGPLSQQQLSALRADPRVLFVEADQVVSLFDQTVPTGIERIFADGNTNIDIDGTDDWRVDVDVAVIDTGIDLDHPDLNVFKSTNCSGGSPFSMSCGSGGDDDHSHGTHVAGTIGALDNGIGVVGVAPGARLWAVKVLRSDGSGYMSWIVAGIDYVTANAGEIEVANMSLGCECSSGALDTAITNSVAAGVVYAVAAGNSDKDASTFSPAKHPDVITVSALADFNGEPGGGAASTCRTDQDDTLADFSNWGSLVEIAAPGVCILSTVPGGYATFSGTSMASPHVAGAAALLASGTNDPTNKTQALAIRDTLIARGNSNWVDDSGDGIKEPLLDVSNTTVFNPALVAGSGGGGGGGTTNTAPVADAVSVTTAEDSPVTATLSGSDAETCELTFSIVTGPSNGSLSGITNNACTSGTPNTDSATVTYTPNLNFNGADSFTYRVSDGSATDDGTVTVTVNAVNDAPVAVDDAYSVAKDTVLTDAAPGVLANDSDADGDALTATLVPGSGPAHGSLALNADGSFTYTPALGYTGPDSFTYTASDGFLSSEATVSLSVNDVSTTVTASLSGSATSLGSQWTATVTVIIVDGNGNPLGGDAAGATVAATWTWNGSSTSENCTAGSNGTCTLSITLHKRFSSVTYQVTNVALSGYEYAGDNPSITIFKP